MEKINSSRWFALLILLTATFLSLMDMFIINVALPAIKNGLHSSNAELQIVIVGYLLGYASFMITGGRAGDHFGRKKIFLWGMAVFTLASCWCGLSGSTLELNIARFLQGGSASFMVPQTISYIQLLFVEPKARAKAIGVFGFTTGLASMFGQFLGGFFTYYHFAVAGWRLIFFINLPIGVAAIIAAWLFIKETPLHTDAKFDISGAAILSLTLFSLIIPIVEGRELGWPFWCIAGLILSVVLFTWFVLDQKRKLKDKKGPLVDLNLFRIKDLNIGLLCVLACYMFYNSYLLVSALVLQNGYHFNALLTGYMFVMFGVGFCASTLFAMRLVTKIGKVVLQAGTLTMIISLALQLWFFSQPLVAPQLVFALILLQGIGAGWVIPPILNITLRSVPEQFAGAASGVYATVQVAAGVLGVSIIGGLFFGHLPNYHVAFHYGAGAELLLLLVILVLLHFVPPGGVEDNNSSE